MATDSKQGTKARVTFSGTDWNIVKTSKHCHSCERQFVEEEAYFSAIYDEIQQFTRKDFCAPCWQKDDKGDVFSFWKTRIPKANTPPQKHLDNTVLLNFFLKLEGNPEPQKQKLRYALALFLMRKKLLKYKDTVRSCGKELLILEYPQEDKVFEVSDPQLTEEEIAALTSNLLALFDSEGAEIHSPF
ncbi:MAG: hypothetical protein ACUZ77_01895 [Candidatus Brocadiales bacterium]